MSYIWELRIADIDGSDFYFPIESEKLEFEQIVKDFVSTGQSVVDKWKPPIIMKKEEKYSYNFFHIREVLSLMDIPLEDEEEYIPEDAVCVTRKIYDDLFSALKNEVEFLRLQSDEGMYYVLNVINIIDCLDKEASICNFAPNGLIIEYEDLIFDMEKLNGQHIFRIPQQPFTIYLTQELKELIEDYEEILFTQDELIFDEVSYQLNV